MDTRLKLCQCHVCERREPSGKSLWGGTHFVFVVAVAKWPFFYQRFQLTSISLPILRVHCVFSCGRDRTVRIWKVEEGSQLVCRAKPRNVSLDAVTMINDKMYFSGSENGSISLWSMHKKKPTYVCKEAHSGKWITSVASLASTDLVATGSSDGGLRLWKVDTGDHYIEEMAHLGVPGFINGLSFGRSGRILVAAIGREHRLGRWERMPSAQAKDGLQIVRLPDFGLRAAGPYKAVTSVPDDNSLEAARNRILPSYE